jgi:hypothetical protein
MKVIERPRNWGIVRVLARLSRGDINPSISVLPLRHTVRSPARLLYSRPGRAGRTPRRSRSCHMRSEEPGPNIQREMLDALHGVTCHNCRRRSLISAILVKASTRAVHRSPGKSKGLQQAGQKSIVLDIDTLLAALRQSTRH